MISIDRKKFILDYLQQNETVTSSVLVQALNVTAMTISRDLKQLEEKGLLVRTHGGAMLPNYIVEETSYAKKKVRDIEVKRRIAEAALRQIRAGMTVFRRQGPLRVPWRRSSLCVTALISPLSARLPSRRTSFLSYRRRASACSSGNSLR